MSLLLPSGGVGAQERSADPEAEQSLAEPAPQPVDEEADDEADEDVIGETPKERRGIEEGRPLPDSWTEILAMREKLQAVKKRWMKTHWLNENRRTRARKAAKRMATVTLEIEQNTELEKLEAIKLHRAGQLLRWRLGQVVALMGTEGTLMLDEIVGNVDLDLHNFYDKMPDDRLGPRGLPPVPGAEEPAQAAEKPEDTPEKSED